ncbi:MAG: DUF4890 domain-containing protein [Prevotella histicola]|jgi:hypothetical protein|uniref:DUF4890 domain-containing protein n=1 Tax=Prevotella histicola TaxID=470565 RepID=UPI001CB031C0|nr:DUF4890 domain-containing protein [Prevotella histicola]MBF1417792.1 DUF4890 domain-containing protein [Prevotella histicola]MBS5896844.1 DUF4890 domain-containing protein [Prevotella histicola]
MKRITLSLLAAALMAASSVSASNNTTFEARTAVVLQKEKSCCKGKMTPQQVTAKMVAKLGLNQEQGLKLLSLNQKYADLFAGQREESAECHKNEKANGATPSCCKKEAQAKKPACCKEKTDCKKAEAEKCNKDKANCSKKDGKSECRKGEQCAKRKAYDAELKQILTEAQYQKYLNR